MSDSAVVAAVGEERDERRASSPSASAAATAPPGFRALAFKVSPWKPDKTKCFVCGVKFTWFNHRHVCRNCREYVCHPCSLSKKVLRAYTPPKRVCDPCISKYWAPKTKLEDSSPASADTESAAASTTDDDPIPGPRPSLTVATEDSPANGYRPGTAPMSVSPSTPMLDGAFFAAGSEVDGKLDCMVNGACDGNRRASGSLLSPSLLASMPEEVEELQEVAAAEVIEPSDVVASPSRTPDPSVREDGDREERAADEEHDAGNGDAAEVNDDACEDNAAEVVLPAEVALPVDRSSTSDEELEVEPPLDVTAPAEPEVVAAAADAAPDAAAGNSNHDGDVVRADKGGDAATRRDTVVEKANDVAAEEEQPVAPESELVPFAVGLGVGLLAAAFGFGMGVLIKYLQ